MGCCCCGGGPAWPLPESGRCELDEVTTLSSVSNLTAEAARDFSRNSMASSILIASPSIMAAHSGAQVLRCTVAARSHRGDLGEKVTSMVMEEFQAELCEHIGELGVPEQDVAARSSQLAARVAAHITVGPVITLLRTYSVTPETVHQPRFVIMVGREGTSREGAVVVRVATFAYVGSPVQVGIAQIQQSSVYRSCFTSNTHRIQPNTIQALVLVYIH